MERSREQFLNILKNAMQGQRLSEPVELTPEEWEELAALARQHKVLPMIYEAVRNLPQLQNTVLLSAMRQQSRQQIILQTQKSYEFLQLFQKLRDAEVNPIVVKGIICRNLYPHPDYRPSSDEDLLILAEQFERCHEVLTRSGMHTIATATQLAEDYEIPYHSGTGPLYIELHRSLFPAESGAYGDFNRFFARVFENAVQEVIEGVPVFTMGYTDHLFYLICHAFKHFLHSGFGIRQICDIILYANAYGSQVDWDMLLQNCVQIRAERFAAAIFRIGSNYLVFDPDRACYPAQWRQMQVEETNLLEDVLLSGVYGSSSMSRRHSSNITLDAVEAEKQNRKSKSGLLVSLFPPANQLQTRYPWLEKHPWLLPVAWTSRIIQYKKESKGDKDNSAAEALKIGSQRVELLREYGIIQ